jgi:hypothetical protein
MMIDFVDTTFVYWTTEREKMRQRRELGQPRETWTDDPMMANYRYCNVSREDDRVTKFIKERIRDPWDQYGEPDELFLAVCLSRFFNLEESLGKLLDEKVIEPHMVIDLHDVHDCLQDYKDESAKHRVFNGAYMVGAPDNYRTYEFGSEKIAYVCGVLKHAKLPDDCSSREGFVKSLNKQFGFSDFMSGQIAADLAYTSILRDAPDHMTWAPRGPGAMRGMNRTVGKPVNRMIPMDEYLAIGRQQLAMLPPEIVEDRKLTLHDVASNVNCETSKYLGLKVDGKAPKRKY